MLYLEIVEVDKLKEKTRGKNGASPSKNPNLPITQPTFSFLNQTIPSFNIKKKFDTQPLLTPTSKKNKNKPLIMNQPTNQPTNQPSKTGIPKMETSPQDLIKGLVAGTVQTKLQDAAQPWCGFLGRRRGCCVFSWEELMVPIKNLDIYIYMCYVC